MDLTPIWQSTMRTLTVFKGMPSSFDVVIHGPSVGFILGSRRSTGFLYCVYVFISLSSTYHATPKISTMLLLSSKYFPSVFFFWPNRCCIKATAKSGIVALISFSLWILNCGALRGPRCVSKMRCLKPRICRSLSLLCPGIHNT